MSPQILQSLTTPTALLDERAMQHNIDRMQQRMQALGVRLRPHVKTAKCIEVARRQALAGAVGITVSTLKEAEEFFAAGFLDILYAVCIAPGKLAQAQALREAGCSLTVLVDSVAAARALTDSGARFEVMIEIDTDGHRAGVLPESALLLQVGRMLHEGGAVLKGVMTHAGASYECRTLQALQAMAEQERSRCVRASERLRDAGLPCPEVSVGSTPTALSAVSLEGVTEVRAGVYIFHDLVMLGIGVCRVEEIALSVLASVIGHQLDKGWVLVDAGWMAMSRDRGTADQVVDWGYGAVCDQGGRLIDGLLMSGANQEHGILSWRSGQAPGDFAARFPVGSRIRLLPNHACATAAQFPHYAVMDAAGELQRWRRFSGW